MERMDEKSIEALKAIVREAVALVINIGLAIREPSDESVQRAVDSSGGLIDVLNDRVDDVGGE